MGCLSLALSVLIDSPKLFGIHLTLAGLLCLSFGSFHTATFPGIALLWRYVHGYTVCTSYSAWVTTLPHSVFLRLGLLPLAAAYGSQALLALEVGDSLHSRSVTCGTPSCCWLQRSNVALPVWTRRCDDVVRRCSYSCWMIRPNAVRVGLGTIHRWHRGDCSTILYYVLDVLKVGDVATVRFMSFN